MASAVLGSLKILLGLDSAQIVSDMGKARAAVNSGMAEIQTRSSAAMSAVSTEIRTLGPGLKGAQQATAVAMKGLELMGSKGSAAVQGIGNALSGLLAGGFTPLGIALGVVTAGVAAFAATEREAAAAAEETAAAVEKNVKRLADLRTVRDLLLRGAEGSPEEVAIVEAEKRVAAIREKLFAATAGRSLFAPTSEEVSGLRQQLATAERDLSVQRDALEVSRQNAELRKQAAAAAKAETQSVASTARALAPAAATQTGDSSRRIEELRASIASANLRFDSERFGVPAEILAQRARTEEARRAAGSFPTDRRSPRFAALTDEQKAMIERVRLEERYLMLLETEWEYSQRQAAQARAQGEAQPKVSAASDAQAREMEAFQRRVLSMREDLAFQIAQMDRDETERAVEEERRRWSEILSDARLGVDERVELEKLLAERLKRIRESMAPKPAPTEAPTDPRGSGFDGGFRDTLMQVRGVADLTRDVGSEAARGLEGAFDTAFGAIRSGTQSVGTALRQFASDFMLDLSAMVAKALVLRAIANGFGGAAPSAAPAAAPAGTPTQVPAPAAAHGGQWRVGGMGGLDSQLVMLRASPGELVRVTNGANSGTGGEPLHATLVVRPPAVIADEVMAKASPAAKAALVYSSLQRGGRRGSRPRE